MAYIVLQKRVNNWFGIAGLKIFFFPFRKGIIIIVSNWVTILARQTRKVVRHPHWTQLMKRLKLFLFLNLNQIKITLSSAVLILPIILYFVTSILIFRSSYGNMH